jgi:hypothetical protein
LTLARYLAPVLTIAAIVSAYGQTQPAARGSHILLLPIASTPTKQPSMTTRPTFNSGNLILRTNKRCLGGKGFLIQYLSPGESLQSNGGVHANSSVGRNVPFAP